MKHPSWTKKLTVLLAAICVALVGLSSFTPAGAQEWLLQVEGVPISRAVYGYFLSEALRDTELKENDRPKDMAALRKDVAARCVGYIAVNSELRAMEIPVDQMLKAQVADRTAFYWRVFGRYYSSIGVDKQTLNSIQMGQAARDQLFRAIYDTGGTHPTSEEALQAYFYGSFVAYDGVRVFRTALQEDGSERDMTPEEIAALKATLAEFVEAANEAGDFYSVAQEERFAEALSYMTPSITEAERAGGASIGGGEELSAEDFEKVRALPRDKISLLDLQDFLLVATGVEMRGSEEEYYLRYRAACLWALQGEAYAEALQELCAQFRADENVAALGRFYKEWKF